MAIAAAFVPAPATASELFGGLYVHDVKTPLNLSGIEGGMDVMLGWRGGRIGSTPLQPYAYGALHTAGDTHYAAAGLSAKFGDRLFIRPGLGIAVHTGSAKNFQDFSNDQVEFGSRILFAPELGIGARISSRASIEASWIHMSHGTLFGRQNPGIDNLGVRLTFGL
jgi:lipid A 3-O-deacylase